MKTASYSELEEFAAKSHLARLSLLLGESIFFIPIALRPKKASLPEDNATALRDTIPDPIKY